MRRTITTLAALILGGCSTLGVECDQFTSQGEAQVFYESQVEHWWTLDPDQNGVACENALAAK